MAVLDREIKYLVNKAKTGKTLKQKEDEKKAREAAAEVLKEAKEKKAKGR